MAKKSNKYNKYFKNNQLLVVAILLVVLLVSVYIVRAVALRGSSASDYVHIQGIRYLAVQGKTTPTYTSSPLAVRPCSGNWNKTECFYVKNISKAIVTVKYLLDCWDETKCTDKRGTLSLNPGQEVQLGLGKPCSRWQLDLNWTGLDGWDWGAVVEVPGDCSASPTPVAPVGKCNYSEFIVP